MQMLGTFLLYAFLMSIVPFCFSQGMICREKSRKIECWIWLTFAVLMLSLVACFREETGTDSAMYIDRYNRQYYRNGYRSLEVGFIILCEVLHLLRLPYQAMFFAVSFIQTVFVFKSIEKEREHIDAELAVFIYISTLYLNSYNAMRQALAIAICIYAILIYLDDKKLQGILLILLAAQIHRTAYMVLFIAFAKLVYDRKSKLLTILSFAIVVFLVFNKQYLNEIYHFFSGQYTGYLSLDSEIDSSQGSWVMYIIKNSPILIMTFVNFKKYINRPKYYNIFGLTIIGVILGMLAYFGYDQVGRIGDYFKCLEILLIPYICYNPAGQRFGKKMKVGTVILSSRTMKYAMYIYYFILFFYNYVFRNFSELLPYKGLFR